MDVSGVLGVLSWFWDLLWRALISRLDVVVIVIVVAVALIAVRSYMVRREVENTPRFIES
jgi:hypothetical protein